MSALSTGLRVRTGTRRQARDEDNPKSCLKIQTDRWTEDRQLNGRPFLPSWLFQAKCTPNVMTGREYRSMALQAHTGTQTSLYLVIYNRGLGCSQEECPVPPSLSPRHWHPYLSLPPEKSQGKITMLRTGQVAPKGHVLYNHMPTPSVYHHQG